MKAGNGTNPDATAQLSIRVEEAPAAAPVPQTGDNTPLEWLGAALVLSAGLFVGLSQWRKRKA